MNPARAKLKHHIIVKEVSNDDEVSCMIPWNHQNISG